MFMEKITALIGDVPAQFQPVVYVASFIAFLWVFDAFAYVLRALVSR